MAVQSALYNQTEMSQANTSSVNDGGNNSDTGPSLVSDQLLTEQRHSVQLHEQPNLRDHQNKSGAHDTTIVDRPMSSPSHEADGSDVSCIDQEKKAPPDSNPPSRASTTSAPSILRQVMLPWISLLLTTVLFVLTVLYASRPALFSGVSYASQSIRRPILTLRVLSGVTDFYSLQLVPLYWLSLIHI